MKTTRLEEALALAHQTLAFLELGKEPLAQVVLRCLRIARLLGYEDARAWCECELRGYSNGVIGRFPDWEQYAHWSARDLHTSDDGKWWYEPAPIELVESRLARARQDYAVASGVPPAIPEPNETGILERVRGATAFERVLATMQQERTMKATEIERYSRIVASLRGTLYDWLSRVVVHLQYGAIVDSAFARAKDRFDHLLADKAPAVAKALAAAYARSYSQDAEERSQALTSCRRALKALADTLYPPTKARPSGHELSDDKYKNRLIEFVADRLRSDSRRQRQTFEAEIELTAARADALNDLASKGVHSEVDERDLELTVVHTYLLAGELLGLLPEPGSGPKPDQRGDAGPNDLPSATPSDEDTKIEEGRSYTREEPKEPPRRLEKEPPLRQPEPDDSS